MRGRGSECYPYRRTWPYSMRRDDGDLIWSSALSSKCSPVLPAPLGTFFMLQ